MVPVLPSGKKEKAEKDGFTPKVKPGDKVNFTKRLIESLPVPRSKRAIYYDAATKGLGILLQPGSTHRAFFWYRKVAGRPTWRTIEEFPTYTVEQARTKAAEFNSELGKWKGNNYEGPSPFEQHRGEVTLSLLLDEYIAKHLKQHAKRPEKAEANARWLFKKYVTSLSSRKVGQIRRHDILNLQQEIADNAGTKRKNGLVKKITTGHTASNRVLQLLRAMYNFAIDQQLWTGENPCSRVKLYKETKRTRFVQPDEMPKLFAALKREPNPDVVDFVNLSLWTGARKSDIFAMRWQDVLPLDNNKWAVPDPKGDPYVVALTVEAIDILGKRLAERKEDNPWVFPSFGKTGHLVDLKGRWRELLKRAGIDNLRQHDLRRTLGSWQAGQGTSLLIIGKSLGHKSQAATQIYSQLNLDPVRESVNAATRAMIAASKKKQPRLAASHG